MNGLKIPQTACRNIAALFVSILLISCSGGNSQNTNVAPVANAGTIQNVMTGTLVALNGSASSDANSNPLTYSWTLTSKPASSAAALTGATTAAPTFSADLAGTYVATLVVNDGTVNSAEATVTITATVANAAPVANAGTIQNVMTGTLVTLNGSASSDANSNPLTYSWTLTSKPAGSAAALTGATTAAPTFTADLAGTYVATLVVNDGTVNSAEATVTITATVANAVPVANAGTIQNVMTGILVTLNGSASSDANSNPLTYSWTLTSKPASSAAALTGATTAAPTFTADLAGTYVATLVVNDGTVNSAEATVTVTATTASISAIATTTAQSLAVGITMASFSPLAPSGGATPYTYLISTGTLPAGLILSTSTGAVTGTPTAVYATAYLVFSVKDANNVTANTTSSMSFTVGAVAAAVFGRLNDTGQTLCDEGSNTLVACITANSGDTSAMPRQDANFGRDALATAGALTKTGAGAAGFDFTKVCMIGTLNCAGVVSNAAAPNPTEWACTKDNNTNLIWSLQTQSDIWSNATSTLPTAANTANRCGFNSGWRLPTRRELLSIVHNGVFEPTIDAAHFPGTAAKVNYWSADIYTTNAAILPNTWSVYFGGGSTLSLSKANNIAVRLVRSGE